MPIHKAVLLQEVVSNLKLAPGQVVFDGTLGAGGHSEEIIKGISPGGLLIGLDLDSITLNSTRKSLETVADNLNVNIHLANDNFRNIRKYTDRLGTKIDRALLDLGISSDQLEISGRGFTFQKDEPLKMSLDPKAKLTAFDIVNTWHQDELEELFRVYGEEQFSNEIATAITSERKRNPIVSTFGLVAIIKRATPHWYHTRKIHPATKVFQAIRIEANDELGSLREFLESFPSITNPSARLAIISFHSLEDRIVKTKFVEWERGLLGNRINKKVLRPARGEILGNKRSRSAKLRVFEFK